MHYLVKMNENHEITQRMHTCLQKLVSLNTLLDISEGIQQTLKM